MPMLFGFWRTELYNLSQIASSSADIYFPNLDIKMKDTLYDKCEDKYTIMPDITVDSPIPLPVTANNIAVARLPASLK